MTSIKYVYLLYVYRELGPTGLMATLDRDNLLAMFDRGWPGPDYAIERAELVECLAGPDEELIGVTELNEAEWGRPCLQVVEPWVDAENPVPKESPE